MGSSDKGVRYGRFISDKTRFKEHHLEVAESALGAGDYKKAFKDIAAAAKNVEALVKVERDETGKKEYRREAAQLRLRAAGLALDRFEALSSDDTMFPEVAGAVEDIKAGANARFIELMELGRAESGPSPEELALPADDLFKKRASDIIRHKPRDPGTIWWYRSLNQLVEARVQLKALTGDGDSTQLREDYAMQSGRLKDDYLQKKLGLASEMRIRPPGRPPGIKDHYFMDMLDAVPDEQPVREKHQSKKRRVTN